MDADGTNDDSNYIDERDVARIVRKECACVIRAEMRRHRMMMSRKLNFVLEVLCAQLDDSILSALKEAFEQWEVEEMDYLNRKRK